MKYLISTLSALAVATSLSLAADPPAAPKDAPAGAGEKHQRPSPEEAFKKMDANSDGFLTLEEFKTGHLGQKDPAKAEEVFKKMDKDGDGKVSLEEFKTGRPPHAPGAGHGPGKGHGGGTPPPAAPAGQ